MLVVPPRHGTPTHPDSPGTDVSSPDEGPVSPVPPASSGGGLLPYPTLSGSGPLDYKSIVGFVPPTLSWRTKIKSFISYTNQPKSGLVTRGETVRS